MKEKNYDYGRTEKIDDYARMQARKREIEKETAAIYDEQQARKRRIEKETAAIYDEQHRNGRSR